jgi:6,7-dimethyl-8-ribityllumazine synthase
MARSPRRPNRRSRRRRVLVVVSRFNETVTRRLLDGARDHLATAGIPGTDVDVVWVPGAFELPLVIDSGLASGKYGFAVALGAVVRGDTPHFEYICAEATRGLGETALRHRLPVGFGLLTCDTLEQALARAGGDAGNKGAEAAAAALETFEALEGLSGRAPR